MPSTWDERLTATLFDSILQCRLIGKWLHSLPWTKLDGAGKEAVGATARLVIEKSLRTMALALGRTVPPSATLTEICRLSGMGLIAEQEAALREVEARITANEPDELALDATYQKAVALCNGISASVHQNITAIDVMNRRL